MAFNINRPIEDDLIKGSADVIRENFRALLQDRFTVGTNEPITTNVENNYLFFDKEHKIFYRYENGTWNPIAKLNLSSLYDVNITSTTLVDNQVLKYDKGKWVNGSPSISSNWSDIIGKPTTISGYGITDAKIESGKIILGTNSITPLTSQALDNYSTKANTIKNLSISGKTITYTKGDNTTGTLTTQDTTYTAGTNITISADNKISATSTTSLKWDNITDKPTTLTGYGITSSDNLLKAKQDKLSSANQGSNINITEVGGIVKISATGTTSIDWTKITNKPTTLTGYGITSSDNLLKAKQDKLTAGTNITIGTDNKISAIDTVYTAGDNVIISSDNKISAIATTSLNWTAITNKPTTLTGYGITSSDNLLKDNYSTLSNTIKNLSISGKTITYTKGDNTTGTLTTQDTVYTHPDSGVTAGTYRLVTVNKQGHVTNGTNPTTLSGYGITDAKISGGVITLGSNTITPLTTHQSLANYSTLSNTIKLLSVSGKTITYTKGDNTTGTLTTQDTTYTAGTGLSLSGTTFSNSGVRSVTQSSTNGCIDVNTNGSTSKVTVVAVYA